MGFKRDEGIGGFLPVVGFIMLIVLGFLAWVLAPEAIKIAKSSFPALRGPGVSAQTLQLGFTFMLFVVFAMVGAGIVAVFAPKPKIQARDADLIKERKNMLEDKALAKRRQRRVNRQMRNL